MLKVYDLHVRFGEVRAVNGVTWTIENGETLAIVGESGSGKSSMCLSLLGLLPRSAAVAGQAVFEGRDLFKLAEPELRSMRGGTIAMIFQNSGSSLNPLLRISTQIGEVARIHLKYSARRARLHALRMLELVGVPAAWIDAYPHQLSGGMRQRVLIAMAIACQPKLLIADEPTSSLDLTIEAQILDLIAKLRDENGTALLLVSHDLGIVADMADRVAVMYAGHIVEYAPKAKLFRHPRNPYTRGLLRSIPDVSQRGHPLSSIGGLPPDLSRLPLHACPFAQRCPEVVDQCKTQFPPFRLVGEQHWSLCHLSTQDEL